MPTQDPRILETQWIPKGLLETKYYYAKVDDLIYYIVARRGIDWEPAAYASEVQSYTLPSEEVLEDNSAEQFNKLVKFLNTPVR